MFISLAIVILLTSCKADPAPPPPVRQAAGSQQVNAIVTAARAAGFDLLFAVR